MTNDWQVQDSFVIHPQSYMNCLTVELISQCYVSYTFQYRFDKGNSCCVCERERERERESRIRHISELFPSIVRFLTHKMVLIFLSNITTHKWVKSRSRTKQ